MFNDFSKAEEKTYLNITLSVKMILVYIVSFGLIVKKFRFHYYLPNRKVINSIYNSGLNVPVTEKYHLARMI